MPWEETTTMEQKLESINEWRLGNFNLSELCREFSISRPTAYKFLKRYETAGITGLEEKQRSPRSYPLRTPQGVEEKILKLRKQHPL